MQQTRKSMQAPPVHGLVEASTCTLWGLQSCPKILPFLMEGPFQWGQKLPSICTLHVKSVQQV